MNRIKWLIVFLAITCSTNAQQFKLVEDTIRINASDFISPVSRFNMKWAVKYHEYYFCIFEDQQIYDYWERKNRLFVISEDGKNIVEYSLPKDFQREYYGDLFVRHDTLYLKPYLTDKKRTGYYFDIDTWQWQYVEEVNDVIYEDDQYSVACIDMGEWGDYSWFKEKNSEGENNAEYIMPNYLSRIIKKDMVYYFIRCFEVDTLMSLNEKAHLCEYSQTYEEVVKNDYKILYDFGSIQPLNTLPIPKLFNFICKDEGWLVSENIYDIYDTICENALLTNGNIYYLLNTKKKTFIAQFENGKMHEKFSLGHQYNFFRMSDNYRGKNLAQNQCFEQFEENINSYGVLEIKDTLIHICHIIHNQHSLPYIGTDNIKQRLKYLLNHLDNLNISQVDSVENSLHATSQGYFKKVTWGSSYAPSNIQTDEFRQIKYYTVVDKNKTLSVDYCVQKRDSVVGGVFFDWLKTKNYNSGVSGKERMANVKQKCAEISQILTTLTGVPPVEVTENNSNSKYLMWTYHNIIVKLYADGRMAMYMIEE